MKILAVGDRRRHDELLFKLPRSVDLKHYLSWDTVLPDKHDIIFDLNFDDFPRNIEYFARSETPVLACSVKKRLSEAIHEFAEVPACPILGMNTLPGFINREIIEICLYGNGEEPAEQLLNKLGWEFRIVEDRAGMVSPRIICMIINEACYALEEGTASIFDIDLAMKLGTNYPYGPFEWADRIGIKDVYETLEAIYKDNKDSRYKICPLLKSKYLRGGTFK